MTTVVKSSFDLANVTPVQPQQLPAVTEEPNPALTWLTTPAGMLTAAVVSVGGGSAAALNLPPNIVLGGSAVLVAAMAGVAATRAIAKSARGLLSTAAIAGLTGVAAMVALGAHSNSVERAHQVAQRSYISQQAQDITRDLRNLEASKRELDTQRQAFAQRVNEAASKLAAPERAKLEAAQTALEAERRAALEPRLAALADEARKLTARQLDDIAKAVEVYNADPSHRLRPAMRIVGEPYSGTGKAQPQQRTIEPSRVVATLVMTGQVYAGPTVLSTDEFGVVPREAAQRITTVAQLIEFLRLSTNLPLR